MHSCWKFRPERQSEGYWESIDRKSNSWKATFYGLKDQAGLKLEIWEDILGRRKQGEKEGSRQAKASYIQETQ